MLSLFGRRDPHPDFPTRERFREFLLQDGPDAVVSTGFPEGCRCPLARCADGGIWVGRSRYSRFGPPIGSYHPLVPHWAALWLNWHDNPTRAWEITARECVEQLDAIR